MNEKNITNEQVAKNEKEVMKFSGKNIPVTVAAKIMGKDQQFVRQGLKRGTLPFGVAFKKDDSEQYDNYISPKLFYEYTGYVYEDDKA